MQTEQKDLMEMCQISVSYTIKIKICMVVHLRVAQELAQLKIKIFLENSRNQDHKVLVEGIKFGQKRCNKDNNNNKQLNQIYNHSFQQAF
jgi:hypothetical protein